MRLLTFATVSPYEAINPLHGGKTNSSVEIFSPMRAPLLRQVSRFFIYQDPFRTETISDPPRLYLRSIKDISRTRVLFLPQLIYYSIFIDIEVIEIANQYLY